MVKNYTKFLMLLCALSFYILDASRIVVNKTNHKITVTIYTLGVFIPGADNDNPWEEKVIILKPGKSFESYGIGRDCFEKLKINNKNIDISGVIEQADQAYNNDGTLPSHMDEIWNIKKTKKGYAIDLTWKKKPGTQDVELVIPAEPSLRSIL